MLLTVGQKAGVLAASSQAEIKADVWHMNWAGGATMQYGTTKFLCLRLTHFMAVFFYFFVHAFD